MKRVSTIGPLALWLAVAIAAWPAPAWPQSHAHRVRPTRPAQVQSVSFNDVPGLGFDYAHLAAVSRPTRSLEISQPPGQVVVPILWGLPLYSVPQPTVIVLQQPAPVIFVQPPLAPAPDTSAEASAPSPRAAEPPRTPLRELREFVLVRRDGTIVLAVAFSTAGDRLIYITDDGIRRSFPIADLDPETTQQMNDANGATLALPN